jgi:putative membrane protein
MVFVDTLGFQLFTLALVSVSVFYGGTMGYLTYRKFGPRRAYEQLRGQAVPLGLLGTVVLTIGLWGETSWPLPGSYNILFFDPYLLLGIALIGFAISVSYRLRTQYVGLLALMTGLLSIYYGYSAYTLGLTKEPVTMLLLYIALGGTAVFTFPVTLFIDRWIIAPEQPAVAETPAGSPSPSAGARTIAAQGAAGLIDGDPPVSTQMMILVGTFLIFLLFAAGSAILAMMIGGGAIPSHLASAP